MPVVSEILGRLQSEVLQPVMTVVFAAGFFLFIWGLVKFLWNVEDGSGQIEGKSHIVWGVVGMFVMVSIWSIIALLDNTFGLGALSGGAATDPSRADSISVPFR